MQYYVILALSFTVSVVTILGVLAFTTRHKIYDTIDERKTHTGNIPRLGGVGVFVGFVFGFVLLFLFNGHYALFGNKFWFVIVGAALIFLMGFLDDIKPWRARYKLLLQCIAVLLVLYSGYTFKQITFGPVGFVWNLGIWRYPLTFCWIIGVTNAINLIDGIDGLSGTLGLLISLTYSLFFYRYGNFPGVTICLLLAVSISAFLLFNLPLPKAKIFLGDGGSQFLGFTLAVLPLIKMDMSFSSVALPYAAAVLLIPIFDTIATIWRRLRDHCGVYTPDRFHLHHKLMLLGFSSRKTLLILAFFQLIISIFVTCSLWTGGYIGAIILFTVYLMGILFFTFIHIQKTYIVKKNVISLDNSH